MKWLLEEQKRLETEPNDQLFEQNATFEVADLASQTDRQQEESEQEDSLDVQIHSKHDLKMETTELQLWATTCILIAEQPN